MLRITSNYEYHKDGQASAEEMLSSAVKDHQSLSANSLGWIIRDIWGNVVKKIRPAYGGTASYKHLRERAVNGLHKNDSPIRNFSDQTLENIRLICSYHGWNMDLSLIAKQSIGIVPNANPEWCKTLSVDGHRLTSQIKIKMLPKPVLNISTYGKEVSFDEIRGKANSELSLRTIDEAICVLTLAMPCVGQNVTDEDEKQFLKLEVGGSKLVTVTSDDSNNQQNLISTSCLLMRFRTKSCKHCLYIEKLFRTRSNKRKVSSVSADHAPQKKCNLRFLDQKGLQKKIAEQKKQLKSGLKRETRIKEAELIELIDEDSQDLMEIVQSTKINDIPPNLKTLWEQQMKQLSMKSPTGYRWDPRSALICLIQKYASQCCHDRYN